MLQYGKIIVKGIVSDFEGNFLEDADVHFQDENFSSLFSTKSDKSGKFEISIDNRVYNSVFICKDYSTKNLEYWHWNFNPMTSPIIEAKIDGLELYGMKAWTTLPAYPGLIVYFRPMSLKKYKSLEQPDKNRAAIIYPELNEKNIKAKINGNPSQILGLNFVKEFMENEKFMGAYLLHLSTKNITDEIKTLSVQIQATKTNERGLGCIDL